MFLELGLLFLFLSSPAEAQLPISADTSAETKVESASDILQRMSLEQKVGQLLILGFSGNSWRPSLSQQLQHYQPGALIAFGRNVRSLYGIGELNRRAHEWSLETLNVPLFIMVDQEGGSVARIKTQPPTPSALALGRHADLDAIRAVGQITGEILFALGFNFNLAPVLDLSDPRRTSFVGNRSFGHDPATVSQYALAYSAGLIQANVIPTAKHFPGHGGITQDSHKKTPSKFLSLEELVKKDLVPFKAFHQLTGSSAMMVAHVAFPNIDPSNAPASFSKVIISDLLRRHMGYKGLVITDDIEMLGAQKAGSIGERAVLAIEAGCDMVMVAWSPRHQSAAYQALLSAARSGRLSEARLNESVLRILQQKVLLRTKMSTEPKPIDELRIALTTKFNNLRDVTRKINRANFDVEVKRDVALTHSIADDREILVFTSDRKFYQALAKTIVNPIKLVPLTNRSLSRVEAYLVAHPESLGVFYVTGQVTARRVASLSPAARARLIVVNATYPGGLPDSNSFWASIEASTLDPLSGKWLGESFFKGIMITPQPRQPAASPEAHH